MNHHKFLVDNFETNDNFQLSTFFLRKFNEVKNNFQLKTEHIDEIEKNYKNEEEGNNFDLIFLILASDKLDYNTDFQCDVFQLKNEEYLIRNNLPIFNIEEAILI